MTAGGWYAGTVTFVIFCIAAPLFLVSTASAQWDASFGFVVLAVVLYSGIRLSWIILVGRRQILQGTFWLFGYVAVGIAPMAQMTTGRSQFVMNDAFVLPALLIVLVGFVAYDVGIFLASRRPPSVVHHPGKGLERELNLTRLKFASVVTLALTAFHIVRYGGVSFFFSNREDNFERGQQLSGAADGGGQALSAMLGATVIVPQLVVLLCWISVYVRSSYRPLSLKLWLAAFILVNIMVNNPLRNSRYWFLTVAIAIFFVWPYIKPALFRFVLIAGVTAAIVIFPISDVNRVNSARWAAREYASIPEMIATKDYDQIPMMANGLWWLEQHGHTWGNQMLGNLLFWVPRSIWPGKPIDTGVEIGTAMGVNNVNLSSPLWIELFADGSVIAVIVGFLLVGWLSARLDARAAFLEARTRTVTLFVDIWVPLLAGYQLILLRGPLLQAMGKLAVLLLLVWFLFSATRQRTEHPPKRRIDRPKALVPR